MEMPPGPPVAGATPPRPPEPGPPVEPPPATSGDEELNRRLVATTAALALISVAIMIAVFLVTRGGDAGEDEAAPAPSPAEAPTGTSVVGGQVDAAVLDEVMPELQAFVEQERDLEFREDIDLTLLGEEAYLARSEADFRADLAEDEEDLHHTAIALRALGLWPEDADPVEVVSRLVSAGSLGYYDPETDEMVVRGTELTPLLRSTLVHELVHALEDQHFDLDRPRLDDRPDEAGLAFSAVVEGSASRVDALYEAGFDDDERAALEAEAASLVEDLDITSFPPILLAQQQFVYDQGEAFVDAVVDAGGNEALDEALRRPPTTSEQLLEPEAWPQRDAVEDVPVPEADGEALEEGVVGQFLLHVLGGAELTSIDGPEWDGDNSVIWEDGDTACIRMAVAGDVAGFEDSLAGWAQQQGAELVRDGDLLVVTSCR